MEVFDPASVRKYLQLLGEETGEEKCCQAQKHSEWIDVGISDTEVG